MFIRFSPELEMRHLASSSPNFYSLLLRFALFSSALMLAGCEKEVHHSILASRGGFTDNSIEIISTETIDGLTVRRVRSSCDDDTSSVGEWLELDGYYGDKSADFLATLLPDLDGFCGPEGDTDLPPVAFMNGKGGRVMDGISIGRLLRQNGVEAGLTWGQSCRASCAGAFLGASSRWMHGDSSLHFNVPFEASFEKSVDCSDSEEWGELTDYAHEMLAEGVARALLDDIWEECDTQAGRAFKSTAALGIGVLSGD